MLMNHLITFNVSVGISRIWKKLEENIICLDEKGFCTVFDDDFNQTLKLEIKTINISTNKTLCEIVCTDNGQPPLSVT